jgi:uncharacterized membrane protein (UPF0182 family)
MTDIYRQELAIPEKRKVFGWMLLFGGSIMVLIAVVLFYQEASLLQKFSVRPWEQPQVKDTKAVGQKENTRQQLLNRTQPLFWIIALSLGLFVAFILVASLNHRIAGHLKNSLGRKKPKTVLGDPWKEAGEKFTLDERDHQ